MNHRILFLIAPMIATAAAACGSGNQPPAQAPTTTSAKVEQPAPAAEPAEKAAPEATTEAQPAAAPAPVEEAAPPKPVEAEKCDSSWTCVSVPLAGAKKVEARATQLIGDPAIDSTVSGMTDDGRGPAKLEIDGKTYEVALKHLPGDKSIVVLRGNGPEITLDKHANNDFTYVGVIAAKKNDALLVDIRWMK